MLLYQFLLFGHVSVNSDYLILPYIYQQRNGLFGLILFLNQAVNIIIFAVKVYFWGGVICCFGVLGISYVYSWGTAGFTLLPWRHTCRQQDVDWSVVKHVSGIVVDRTVNILNIKITPLAGKIIFSSTTEICGWSNAVKWVMFCVVSGKAFAVPKCLLNQYNSTFSFIAVCQLGLLLLCNPSVQLHSADSSSGDSKDLLCKTLGLFPSLKILVACFISFKFWYPLKTRKCT